ncbi:hypothetical protein ACTPED_20320, partial [Clostridioides difficile]|uniref:hypothetical protein n=1 Tax=Clostridioides difficile TaxID=1496 RepID=UPI003F8D4690
RREHWADPETSDISFEEWLIYVNSDRELELMEGESSQGYCEWNTHPTERAPNSRPWFSYWNGNIDTKNPDAPTIRRMIGIASVLNAKVQGDDYTQSHYLNKLHCFQPSQGCGFPILKN